MVTYRSFSWSRLMILVLIMMLVLACSVFGGSKMAGDSVKSEDANAQRGGDFTLPNPINGLPGLEAYNARLMMAFEGLKDGFSLFLGAHLPN